MCNVYGTLVTDCSCTSLHYCCTAAWVCTTGVLNIVTECSYTSLHYCCTAAWVCTTGVLNIVTDCSCTFLLRPSSVELSIWLVPASPQYRVSVSRSRASPLGHFSPVLTITFLPTPSIPIFSIFGFLPQSVQNIYLKSIDYKLIVFLAFYAIREILEIRNSR